MNYSTQQQAIIDCKAKRIAVLAVPGSGKSRVLVGRIQRLLEDGVPPDDIAAISYTRNASQVLQNRLGDVRLGANCTLHSFIFQLLKEHGRDIGLPSNLAVIDEATAEEILAETVKEHGYKGTKTVLNAALENVPFLLKSKGLLGEQLVSAAYHLKLIQNGLMDYNGILAYGLHLLETIPTRWSYHLFVDEIQDASEIDFKIYKALYPVSMFAVGDTDQSIFAFRGGSGKHFDNFSKTEPGCYTFIMGDNYRSGAVVCHYANQLISHNANRIKKEIMPTIQGGYVEVKSHHSEAEQCAAVTLRCAENKAKTQAVLCRTNWQADEYATALAAAGLPIYRRGDQVGGNMPEDWGKARLAVAFWANPENDLLAYQFLVQTKGLEVANNFRRRAALTMKSINQDSLRAEQYPAASVPMLLRGYGISEASIELVFRVSPVDTTMVDLSAAMAEAAAISKSPDTSATENVITVSTIHGAKGCEYDCVYLPSFNQEMFPGGKTGEALEEERRLAFVALTRAKESVWIGTTQTGRRYAKATKPEPMTPSQFIAEAMQ